MGIEYQEVQEHWDSSFKGHQFRYGDGYKIEDEKLAKLRFRKEVNVISTLIGERKTRFLDVGCGNGKMSLYFAKYFTSCVGIDFSQSSIAIATKEAEKRELTNCTFKVGDLREIADTEKFDVIFGGGVLMYINDADVPDVLKRLYGLLSDKGVLIFREPLFVKDKELVKDEKYHVIYRSRKSFMRFMREARFTVVKVVENQGQIYGVLVDGIQKIVGKWLAYHFFAKKMIVHLLYVLFGWKVQVKGYFVCVKKEKKSF